MIRNCIGCGQEDDHPRHVVVLPDGTPINWHHDCHAMATGNAVSKAIADSGLKGDELRTHIQDNDPGQAVIDAQQEADNA